MCDVFTLGRVYTRIKTALGVALVDLDPALYIQRAVHALELASDEEIREVSSFSVRLINVAKRDWMVSGRRPTAIAAAALMLAVKLKSQKKKSVKEVADSLNVAVHTVRRRYKELTDLLVDLGKKHLPWGQNITKRNLFSHVSFILQHTELVITKEREAQAEQERRVQMGECSPGEVASCFSKADPPSFKANETIRKRRQEKIDRAKKRVARMVHTMDVVARSALARVVDISAFLALAEREVNSADGEKEQDGEEVLDEEDLLLEKLLLQGLSEAALLDGYYDSCEQSLLAPPAAPTGFPPFASSFGDELELDEGDIPDSEMFRFIKTPKEVRRVKRLQEHVLELGGVLGDDEEDEEDLEDEDEGEDKVREEVDSEDEREIPVIRSKKQKTEL